MCVFEANGLCRVGKGLICVRRASVECLGLESDGMGAGAGGGGLCAY